MRARCRGRNVTRGRQPFPGGRVGSSRHIAHSRGVDPYIVEIEECTYSDGIVQGLFAPTRGLHLLDIVHPESARLPVDLFDEGKKRLFLFTDRGRAKIPQHRVDQGAVAQQGRRDRGVRTDSEKAVVAPRGKSRDQLAETRR